MLAALRHSELASLPDRIQKQALVRLTGHDSGPSSPAFQNALFGVQPQPAHLLVGMATEALLRKKWTNACFEELLLLLRHGGPYQHQHQSKCGKQMLHIDPPVVACNSPPKLGGVAAPSKKCSGAT